MQQTIGKFLFRWRNQLFPVIFLLLFLFTPASPNAPLLHLVGQITALLGVSVRLAVAGVHYIKRAGLDGNVHAIELFVCGPFALTRNPLYVGNVLIAIGFMVQLGEPLVFLVGSLIVFLAYQSIIAVEEHFLRNRFGSTYEQYVRDVPRWIPNFSHWRKACSDATFCWRRAIIMDYSTTGAVFLGLLAIAIRDTTARGQAIAPGLIAAVLSVLILIAAVRLLKKTGRLRIQ